MIPVDVRPSMQIEFNKENIGDPKFRVGDNARIPKHKDVFAERYVPNWFEVFVIKKVKYTALWTYVNNDLKGESYDSNLKWKGYDSSFNI